MPETIASATAIEQTVSSVNRLKDYRFHVSCQKSVPEAIIAFLVSNDYESAVRRAVAYGGDADMQQPVPPLSLQDDHG